MNRQTVLLMFGGESSEHEVSILSAKNVHAAIDKEKYDVKLCYITKDGTSWILVDTFDNLHGDSIYPLLGKGKFRSKDEEFAIDVIFPMLHGENGSEDGAIQGLANLLHVSVVGCDIASSVVCWDKLYAKQILGKNNIKTTPYIYHRRGHALPDYDRIVGTGGDLFIKPATAGSSIGVSKVSNKDDFEMAIALASKHSSRVLVEKAIKGREFEVAVLAVADKPWKVSGVGEIIPGEEFYSYDDKYSASSKARVVTNADISTALKEEIRSIARRAFYVLGCKGLARVDFLVSDEGEIYVNEINTMPGFTDISMYPKLIQQSGISYPELIDELITHALKE